MRTGGGCVPRLRCGFRGPDSATSVVGRTSTWFVRRSTKSHLRGRRLAFPRRFPTITAPCSPRKRRITKGQTRSAAIRLLPRILSDKSLRRVRYRLGCRIVQWSAFQAHNLGGPRFESESCTQRLPSSFKEKPNHGKSSPPATPSRRLGAGVAQVVRAPVCGTGDSGSSLDIRP